MFHHLASHFPKISRTSTPTVGDEYPSDTPKSGLLRSSIQARAALRPQSAPASIPSYRWTLLDFIGVGKLFKNLDLTHFPVTFK